MRNRALVVWIFVLVALSLLAGCGAAPQGTNVTVSDIGNVEGTVTDSSSSAALSGVTIQIGDKTATTGSNGVYSIQDINVGTRTVTASKTGYQNHNGPCEVNKGTTVVHSIQLTANSTSDTTPPTASSTSPANNAADIAVNSSVTVTFSEAMDVSTITTTTFTLKQGTTPVSGTVTYSGTIATFTPSSNLSYSTAYTATITTGAMDTTGNVIASSYSWSFTTGTAPDTTPPTVSSTNPANNATGIAINSAITATFSETMDTSTITTGTFYVGGVSGTVTYNGTTATFTPSSNLNYNTAYTFTVTNSVKDAAGNAMASNYSWSFTTGSAPDTTPPTVSSISPANNATEVAINGAITATFSETMDSSTVTTSTFTLKQGTTAIVGTVTYNGTTVTFTPSSNLAYSTTYTATITTGVKDAAGNAMASNYTWSFTTGSAPDTTPPIISSTSPANNATGIAINSAITATFSETMESSTVTTSTFTLKQGTIAIAVTVAYNGTTATFTPSSSLSYSTTYTATVTTGVKDAAGNAMASDYSWSFTTGAAPDMTPPIVNSTAPASGTTWVALNSTITATFNEKIDSSTVTTATFTVYQGTNQVTGTVTYTENTVTFTPTSDFFYNTTYTATIASEVKDLAGNAMVQPYTWSFTTLSQTVVTGIAAGFSHSLAITATNSILAWGRNNAGQLGDGTTTDRYTPVSFYLSSYGGGAGVTSITAGNSHSIALGSAGLVLEWGDNDYGQLGNGTTVDSATPIVTFGNSDPVVAIASAGGWGFHTLVIDNFPYLGGIRAWGRNEWGQLGNGSTTSIPKTTPGGVVLYNAVAVAAGRSHSLAIKNDGTVWAWGLNGGTYGTLGDGTTTSNSTTPVQVSGLTGIIAIAAGPYHSLALKNDGTVWAWGRNNYGQLGDGTTVNRNTPVQITGLNGITAIAAGYFHGLAVKNDGTVWEWGDNSWPLGAATTIATPHQLSGLANVKAVAAGYSHRIALKNDGTVWTRGDNSNGQLGDGTTNSRTTPVRVSGL